MVATGWVAHAGSILAVVAPYTVRENVTRKIFRVSEEVVYRSDNLLVFVPLCSIVVSPSPHLPDWQEITPQKSAQLSAFLLPQLDCLPTTARNVIVSSKQVNTANHFDSGHEIEFESHSRSSLGQYLVSCPVMTREPTRLSAEAFDELRAIVSAEIKGPMPNEEIEEMGVRLLELFSLLSPVNGLAPAKVAMSDQDRKALAFLRREILTGRNPSVRDLTRAVGLRSSRSGFRLLQKCLEMGWLSRNAEGRLSIGVWY